MNRKEAERQIRQAETLRALGFTEGEAESLRRISMTLRRWHELECGVDDGRGDTFYIERENADGTGRPFMAQAGTGRRYPIADRETGALLRLAAIVKARNARIGENPPRGWGDCGQCGCTHPDGYTGDCRDDARRWPSTATTAPLSTYIQTDPRGAALYIIRPGDVPEGADVSAYYNRGICVY